MTVMIYHEKVLLVMTPILEKQHGTLPIIIFVLEWTGKSD